MGNNHSHQPQQSTVNVVRRPPSRPNAPPSSRPLSELGPKGPSYHSPENQVLPREIPSILKLRPVSMELSKYRPEYENMFSHENNEHLDDNKNEIAMESQAVDKPDRPPPPVANGNIPTSPSETPISPVTQLPNGTIQTPSKLPINTAKSAAPYRPSHRRQMSLGHEHTILEEPDESIDSRVKLDPLMQSFPGATGPSLPVKNNFNLDYSYQLTYVQLAEHRRNKTIEELEKRTGKRLSDLSADLSEHMEKPMFVRDAASRVSSRSTGSLGSGLSSKKKKAPPPPGQAPPPPPMTSTSKPYSVHNEPPVDYDIESPRKSPQPVVMLPRYTAAPPVSRVSPSVNKSVHAPPPPPGSSPRKPVVNLSRSASMSNGTPEIILKKTPEVKPTSKVPEATDGKVPWLLEIKTLSEARAAKRQQSQEASVIPDVPPPNAEVSKDVNEYNVNAVVESEPVKSKAKLVFESSEGQFKNEQKIEGNYETAEKNVSSVERSNSMKKSTPSSTTITRHLSTTEFDRRAAPQMQRQSSEPGKQSPGDPVRRLSSLLQHDIKSAANSKCLKLVKQTTPVLPKPKDPHTVFREQLQKACAERDERAKIEGTIDDKLKLNSSASSQSFDNDQEDDVVKYNTTPRSEKKEESLKKGPNTLPKPPRYHKNVSVNKSSAVNRISKASKSARDQHEVSMSLDWTPEVDLDSDDNISDREVMTNRKGSSEGFKSTIIPSTMTEMKNKKKYKSKKQPKENGVNDDPSKKFGSVRKLRKSVNKSVKNAFGSISKASGKLLRKQKSEDFETVEDAPRNWSLTAGMDRQSRQSDNFKVPNGYGHDDASDSDDDEPYNAEKDFSEIVFRQKSKQESEESSDSTYESEDKTPQNIRRAGVAYISSKGKLVLMDDEDEDKMIEKRKSKDKKEKRKSETMLSQHDKLNEVREMERKLEEEKRKKLEMELEMHKQREAETRERLQRLEQAHLQQQLLYQQQQQQQQQQQNIGLLGAPALPPAGGFQSYATLPSAARSANQSFTNVFGQQLSQNGFQPNYSHYQTGSYLNGTVPGMSYDLNDYMRMLGVQNPPTSQQMAYFLNSMTLTGQPFDRKSNPVLFDMFNQQYPTGTYSYPGMDGSLKKPAFQHWASSPNISVGNTVDGNIPLADFVASYNGANKTNPATDNTVSPKNPLYDTDDSDEGLSPQKTVARAQVKDYRKVPVRTESGKFMRKYASENFVTQTDPSSVKTDIDTSKSFTIITQSEGLPQQIRSVSPSNSVSTVDSAMSSPSVTLSTPSSPSRSFGAPSSPTMGSRSHGFRTVLDLSAPNGSMQIISGTCLRQPPKGVTKSGC